MPLTKVSFSVIQVANNVTSTTVGNTTSIPSITFDQNGVISTVSNTAISGAGITANSVANSAFQTGSVENYLRGANLDFGMRNRIINGAMVIDQRNAGASVTSTTSQPYTLDRWQAQASASSKYTVQQNAGSVTPPVGFVNYLGVTSSAATSVSGTDYYAFVQKIEGYNIADLNWGSANAKTVTLSFWVRSSLTGTFGGALQNGNQDRSYPFTYTISAANTWEQKSVTVAGDTTGTWGTTTGTGIILWVGLGVGSTYSGTAGAWAAGLYVTATGATSVVGTSGATFYITGVQLEVGSSATGFEYRLVNQELSACQRYFQRLGSLSGGYVAFGSGRGGGSTTVVCYFKYANSVRATPTISQSNTAINYPAQAAVTSFGSIYYGTDSAGVELTTADTVSNGTALVWLGNATSSAYVDISAEL